MVRLPQGYCIDSTEVTRTQYEAWLATNPSSAAQTSDCAWHTTFVPDAACMAGKSVCQTDCGDHPQVCVDWCDAYEYCQAVGKRLCGKIGGGALAYDDFHDVSTGQWYNACTSGDGSNLFVWGRDYQWSDCNYDSDTTVPVAWMPSCQPRVATYAGVYDLNGNVLEWQDSCSRSGELGACSRRGGAFNLGLGCYGDWSDVRHTPDPSTGFRCCSL